MGLTQEELNQRISLLKDVRRHARKRPRLRKGTAIAGLRRKKKNKVGSLSAADFPALRAEVQKKSWTKPSTSYFDSFPGIEAQTAPSPDTLSIPPAFEPGLNAGFTDLGPKPDKPSILPNSYVAAFGGGGDLETSITSMVERSNPALHPLEKRDLYTLELAIFQERTELLEDWFDKAVEYIGHLQTLRDELIGESEPPVHWSFYLRMSRHLLYAMADAHHALFVAYQRLNDWSMALNHARDVIDLRDTIARAILGERLKPTPRDYLKRAYADYMLNGNTQGLRDGLREGLTLIPDAHALGFWLYPPSQPHPPQGTMNARVPILKGDELSSGRNGRFSECQNRDQASSSRAAAHPGGC